jgi:hypothetical protein
MIGPTQSPLQMNQCIGVYLDDSDFLESGLHVGINQVVSSHVSFLGIKI